MRKKIYLVLTDKLKIPKMIKFKIVAHRQIYKEKNEMKSL